jgi:hypothetical protein
MERRALPLRDAMRNLLMLLSCHCPASPRDFFVCATLARRLDLSGHRISSAASLGRDEWVLLIYFPDKPDGKATVSKFTGTRAVVAGAARRKIDNWLSEKKRKALQPKRPARKIGRPPRGNT